MSVLGLDVHPCGCWARVRRRYPGRNRPMGYRRDLLKTGNCLIAGAEQKVSRAFLWRALYDLAWTDAARRGTLPDPAQAAAATGGMASAFCSVLPVITRHPRSPPARRTAAMQRRRRASRRTRRPTTTPTRAGNTSTRSTPARTRRAGPSTRSSSRGGSGRPG